MARGRRSLGSSGEAEGMRSWRNEQETALQNLILEANTRNMREQGHDRYWACIVMYNPVLWRYNYITGETVMVEVEE